VATEFNEMEARRLKQIIASAIAFADSGTISRISTSRFDSSTAGLKARAHVDERIYWVSD
jgi:hypothetical protein